MKHIKHYFLIFVLLLPIILPISSIIYGPSQVYAAATAGLGRAINSTSGSGNNSTSGSNASCENGFGLAWILCSVISGLASFILNLYRSIIDPILKEPQSSMLLNVKQPYFQVWSNFRIYGDIVLVIALLVIVFGESIGGGLIDAYSAKKILPRLLAAAILINISIYLVAIALDVTDILGSGIYSLFVAPFHAGNLAGLGLHLGGLGTLLGYLITGAGAIWISTAGGGFLHFLFITVLGSGALILFSTMITIIIRVALILGLLFVSPVAFALYCLPNTEQYFRKWWNLLFKALLVYPIVGAIFALSNITALTLSNLPLTGLSKGFAQVLALFGLFTPLILIPFAFRFAGGAMGAIHDGIGGRISSSGFKGIAGLRAKRRQVLHERRMGGEGKMGSGAVGALYRGVATLGEREGWTPTAKGRSRFAAFNQRAISQYSDKKLEEGGARAFSDDNISAVLSRGLSGRAAVEAIVNGDINPATGKHYDDKEALAAISRAEVATGLTAGSDAMRVAAQKYRSAISATAYSGNEAGLNEQRQDLKSLIDGHLITQEDAATWMKSNKSRSDYSANSWGNTNKFIKGDLKPEEQLEGAFFNADVRDIISNHQMGVNAMAEQARRSLVNAFQKGTVDDQQKALAAIGNIHNVLSSTSPTKAASFADKVLNDQSLVTETGIKIKKDKMETTVDIIKGEKVTRPVTEEITPRNLQEYIDSEVRAKPQSYQLFHSLERNYANAREAAMHSVEIPPPTPPPTTPSDKRFKTDISYLTTMENGIKLYSFRYIWGGPTYVGVLAQDILRSRPECVETDKYGYYYVNYNMLGIKMIPFEEYEAEKSVSI